jgi:hypothetical protein
MTMYQINLRSQAGKLALLAAQWQDALVRQSTAPHLRRSRVRAALSGLANLATLRAMPGAPADLASQHDPRDPRNW